MLLISLIKSHLELFRGTLAITMGLAHNFTVSSHFLFFFFFLLGWISMELDLFKYLKCFSCVQTYSKLTFLISHMSIGIPAFS